MSDPCAECKDLLNLADNAIKQQGEVIALQAEQLQDLRFQRDYFKAVSEEPPGFWDTTTGKLVLFGAGIYLGSQVIK